MTDPAAVPAPVPIGLDFLARFRVELDPLLDLGTTPWGHRRIVPIVGGFFDGPRLSGTVLPGGADWQVVHDDGSISIDTRYTLRTSDSVLIYIATAGTRTGPPEVLARLNRGEVVDPAEYYFRVHATFETAAPAYRWLNTTLVVASAVRTGSAVDYDAYAVT